MINIKPWKERLSDLDEYGRPYEHDIEAADAEIAELRLALDDYSDMLRAFCCRYAAGGWNSEGLLDPNVALGKLEWIVEEASRHTWTDAKKKELASVLNRFKGAAPAMGEELPPPPWGTDIAAWMESRVDDEIAEAFYSYGRACMALRQPPIHRAVIKEVFIAHGFTIKEGQTDLKSYVYEAAEALLALRPTAALSKD